MRGVSFLEFLCCHFQYYVLGWLVWRYESVKHMDEGMFLLGRLLKVTRMTSNECVDFAYYRHDTRFKKFLRSVIVFTFLPSCVCPLLAHCALKPSHGVLSIWMLLRTLYHKRITSCEEGRARRATSVDRLKDLV